MQEIYTDFFGFDSKPFNVTPDPEFIFYSDQHKEALAHMVYGVKERKGFILVTGRVGTGKTTLCRAFLRELDESTKTALVLNTTMDFNELLVTIAEDFGLDLPENPSTKTIIDRLNEFVLDEYRQGRNVCLIIDESQNLSPEVLENFRLLSNLETDKEKLLQIVLVGQPELDSILSQKRLRQLKQRVAVRSHLSNLSQEETRKYVLHRLNEADPDKPVRVNRGIFERLYRVSSGNPRAINLICDRMLMAAYLDDSFTLTETHLEKAAEELIEETREGAVDVNDSRIIRRLRRLIRNSSFLNALNSPEWWFRAGTGLAVTLILGFGLLWLNGFGLNYQTPEKTVISADLNPNKKTNPATSNPGKKDNSKAEKQAETIPNPLGISTSGGTKSLTLANSELRALGRLVSYKYSRLFEGNRERQVELSFNENSRLREIIPAILPGRVIELSGRPGLFLDCGFPAFLHWQDNTNSSRYVLHIPGYKKLWDPLKGWLKLDLNTVGENWSGRGKIILNFQHDPTVLYGTGRSGPAVKQIQRLLSRAGGYDIPLVGHYGPMTTRTVKKFQKNHNLPVDGIIGPKTLIPLLKAAGANNLGWRKEHLNDFIGRFSSNRVSHQGGS